MELFLCYFHIEPYCTKSTYNTMELFKTHYCLEPQHDKSRCYCRKFILVHIWLEPFCNNQGYYSMVLTLIFALSRGTQYSMVLSPRYIIAFTNSLYEIAYPLLSSPSPQSIAPPDCTASLQPLSAPPHRFYKYTISDLPGVAYMQHARVTRQETKSV